METLPAELRALIAFWVRETDIDYSSPDKPRSDWARSRDLWRLRRVNRSWSESCSPLLYEFFTLRAEQVLDRSRFVEHLAEQYGHLIRAFRYQWTTSKSTQITELWHKKAEEELIGALGHLTNLRTLFASDQLSIIKPLADLSLTRTITTLDYSVKPRRGLLRGPSADLTSDVSLISSSSFPSDLFPALEDLSIAFVGSKYRISPDVIEAAPESTSLLTSVLSLPRLRALTLHGIVLRTCQPSLFLYPPPLRHLDLSLSYIETSAAVSFTSRFRDTLTLLGIGLYDFEKTSDPAEVPAFDLPHLTSVDIGHDHLVSLLKAFLSSTLVREIRIGNMGRPVEQMRNLDPAAFESEVRIVLEAYPNLKFVGPNRRMDLDWSLLVFSAWVSLVVKREEEVGPAVEAVRSH